MPLIVGQQAQAFTAQIGSAFAGGSGLASRHSNYTVSRGSDNRTTWSLARLCAVGIYSQRFAAIQEARHALPFH
jgi:hypothetical protein